MSNRVFFFGVWNTPNALAAEKVNGRHVEVGHYLYAPSGHHVWDDGKIVYYGDRIHLDGSLAPRKYTPYHGGGLCWSGSAATPDGRNRITYDSAECPQGQFLMHHLDNGFTAIAWWDRCHGDTRPGCSSTVLLEGAHDAPTMLEALRTHFPHVIQNLTAAGVMLVNVTP